jgi:hypothetical protein
MIQAAGTGDLEDALRVTSFARQELDRCEKRWNELPEHMRSELPAPAGDRSGNAEEAAWQLVAARAELERVGEAIRVGRPRDLEQRLAVIARHIGTAAAASRASGQALAHAADVGGPLCATAEDAGERLLRDLAAGPRQIKALRAWLRPTHFARPAHGQLYATMRDMDAAGKPVDPVTITSEAARRGIPVDVDLDNGTAPFAVSDARQVYRYGLLAQITQAGRDIAAAASDPQSSTRLLFQEATRRLRDLEPDGGPEQNRVQQRPGSRGIRAVAMPQDAGAAQPRSNPEAVA